MTDPRVLHDTYTAASGMAVTFTMRHSYAWEVFSQQGFTAEDIIVVCWYLHRELQKPNTKRTHATLQFRRLIEDTHRFGDELATARSLFARNKPSSPKARVLAATGRAYEKVLEKPALSAAQILAKHKELSGLLKEWRESNA